MVSHCAGPTRGVCDRALHEHRIPSSPPSHLSKRPLRKIHRLSHVLFDIRLQMPRSRLPIIRRVADMAGEEDDLVSSIRGRTKSFVLPRVNRSTD